MKIVGLSEKGAKWLPIIISWIVFITLSLGYLTYANADDNKAPTVHDLIKSNYLISVVDIKHKETGKTKKILHITGTIGDGIAERTEEFLNKYKIDEVILNSGGGFAGEGFALSYLFAEKNIPTKVARGTRCFSACAAAFLGGSIKTIDNGVLGLHRSWIPEGEEKTKDAAFARGQEFGMSALTFYLSHGYSADLAFVSTQNTDGSKFMVFTSTEELAKYYVNKNTATTPIEAYFTTNLGLDNVKIWGPKETRRHLDNNPNKKEWKVVKIIDKFLNEDK